MSFTIKTYSAAIAVLSPAGSPTDVLTLLGAAGVITKVQRIRASGISTLGGTIVLRVIKRSSADTGGTSSTVTAVSHDSDDSAAASTCLAYTANPTLGSAVGDVRTERVALGVVGSYAGSATFDFGNIDGKALWLKSATEQLALNFNGAAPGGASVSLHIEWTEE